MSRKIGLKRHATWSLGRMIGFCALALALLVSACASVVEDRESAPSPVPIQATRISAKSAEKLTVMDLLQKPLEGQAEVDKIVAALPSLMKFEPLISSQFYAEGPATLADGYVVTFAFLRNLSSRVDIGLEPEPCFPPELAERATSAVKSEMTQDAHGVDVGEIYTARRNGVLLRFTTTRETYRCVEMIYISRIK